MGGGTTGLLEKLLHMLLDAHKKILVAELEFQRDLQGDNIIRRVVYISFYALSTFLKVTTSW